ncbi:MvdC/MvdD family ATP grasp protein [Streptomyces sp. NPDC058280]|uniref:MvdC/MvdD family ATP grasp protein n=1 Tax=Streptomyces sp. NPDC058280 TaxID=3346419 RepID=UPI0036EBB387
MTPVTEHTRLEGTGSVCVVTTRDDVTADLVIPEISRLGAPVLRVHLDDFPQTMRLSATGPKWAGTLGVGNRHVRLEKIRAVWWWHPEPVRIAPGVGMTLEQAEWASREANAGVAGVLAALPNCLHVNHPAATYAAQSKADVLVQAPLHGLAMPPTWIGNAPAEAQEFASGQERVMCKSLSGPTIRYRDAHATLFTTPVKPAQLDERIAAGAHQLQYAVDKQFEVRLVVVGEDMFAARIDAHSTAARADYRADYGALSYTTVSVPDSVRDGVIRLMAHYGLVYAALDLLVDADGRWLLIDLNPSGQYGWIEQALPNLRISAAIAELLCHAGNGEPHAGNNEKHLINYADWQQSGRQRPEYTSP